MTRVPANLAGKQGPCPGCKKVIEVPRPGEKKKGKEPARAEEKKKEKPKAPPLPEEEVATGTVSAPAADEKKAGARNDPLSILRQLPPGLVAGLLLAVVVPILGLPICIYYSRSSPPDSLAKRWGRNGMYLALVAVVMFFLAGQYFAAQRQRGQQPQGPQTPAGVRAPPSSPGKLR